MARSPTTISSERSTQIATRLSGLTPKLQMMRQTVGLLVQLPIAQRAIFIHHRYRLGIATSLFFEQLVDTKLFGILRLCLIPLNQKLMALLGGQDRQGCGYLLVVGHHLRQGIAQIS